MWKTINFSILVSTLATLAIFTTTAALDREGGVEICVNFENSTRLPSAGQKIPSGLSIEGFRLYGLDPGDPPVSRDGIEFRGQGLDIVFPYVASAATFVAAAKAGRPATARILDAEGISSTKITIQSSSNTMFRFSGGNIFGIRFTEGRNEGVVRQICITRDAAR